MNKHLVKAAWSAVVGCVTHQVLESDSLGRCRAKFSSSTFREIQSDLRSVLVTEGEDDPTFQDMLDIATRSLSRQLLDSQGKRIQTSLKER